MAEKKVVKAAKADVVVAALKKQNAQLAKEVRALTARLKRIENSYVSFGAQLVVRSAHSGKVLDVDLGDSHHGHADGGKVHQWHYGGARNPNKNQVWTLRKP